MFNFYQLEQQIETQMNQGRFHDKQILSQKYVTQIQTA